MLHIETPLIASLALSQHAGRPVHLKMEALQPSGSFKLRGMGHACEVLYRRGVRRFVSSSGGNAGIAVALAGRRLGVPVTVVLPRTATPRAHELLHLEGAEVKVHGASWQEAHEFAQSLVTDDNALLHPFDDPLVWTGHATMIDEVVAAGLKPDLVILSVGGGGLLCGVSEGLARNGLGSVPILAVETAGADSLAAAIKAGRVVELPKITSIAASLGARAVCARAFELTTQRRVDSMVVSDQAATEASVRFLEDHRVLVEPACGAALAVVYERSPCLEGYREILVIVCGGAGVSPTSLLRVSDDYRNPP
jgi:L-serine/L-threonine ammonia-lyase